MTSAEYIMLTYGEDVMIGNKAAKGFVSCLDSSDEQIHSRHFAPGVTNKSRYRLITAENRVRQGDEVECAGRRFVVLRVEPVRIFGEFSHNECMLCLKGGGSDA